jgi:riboflavin kinase
MIFEGVVKSGHKEGSKYVKIYKDKIKEIIKKDIYEGTLNIKIDFLIKKLKFKNLYIIDEFNNFGRVLITPCKINNLDAYIVLPEKTKHKYIFEIISSYHLREKLNLKDGDKVKIEVDILNLS